jgi:excinuclease ABC subunit A
MIASVADHYGFSLIRPLRRCLNKIQDVIFYGSGDEKIQYRYHNENGAYTYQNRFEGAIHQLTRRYQETDSEYSREKYEEFMSMDACPTCQGQRLSKASLSVKIGGQNIIDFTKFSVKHALEALTNFHFSSQENQIAVPIIKRNPARLNFMSKVGLDYLTLDRATTATLSGGEGQRIRLATQIGSGLVGVLYISWMEPSIGLHQRDTTQIAGNAQSPARPGQYNSGGRT